MGGSTLCVEWEDCKHYTCMAGGRKIVIKIIPVGVTSKIMSMIQCTKYDKVEAGSSGAVLLDFYCQLKYGPDLEWTNNSYKHVDL